LADTRRLGGHRPAPPQRAQTPDQPNYQQDSLAFPLPLEEAQRSNGSQATTSSAATDSWDAIARDVAESQQAGLVALFRLAKAATPSGPSSAVRAGTPPSEPSPSPQSLASSAPARTASAVAPSAPLIDQPEVAQGPAPSAPNGWTATGTQPNRDRGTVWSSYSVLLLVAILTIQAVLSLQLAWTNTAYIDEATYLWAGHLEIAHWLHGAQIPPFQTWFSGAPVVYPPVAAVADSVGGLVGARILSLAFMTGTTALLWNIASKLFDSRVAFFATALFAILGPTQFLGALATYDAMALFLIAISAWCIVAARDHDDSTLLLVAGASALALANATKYATTLFDPVVVVLGALIIAEKRGAKPALGRAGYLATLVTALVAALLALGGPLYMVGVMYTTLARAVGGDPSVRVLEDSWRWVGVVCVLAWTGVIICLRRGSRVQAMLLAVLAVAGMLAPLEQARIHTITSLHKHVDFGAWLAAPAAGYALARLSRFSTRRSLSFVAAGLMAAVVVLPAGMLGSTQAKKLFHGWPDFSSAITQLRTLTRTHPGNYLAEDYDIPAYYLESSVSWQRWSDTWFFSYTPQGARRPLIGAAAYQAAIARHYFSLVLLDFGATPGTDRQITGDMQRTGGYQIIAVVSTSFGHYTVWAYRPPQQPRLRHGHH
jgi:hypothetical protein